MVKLFSLNLANKWLSFLLDLIEGLWDYGFFLLDVSWTIVNFGRMFGSLGIIKLSLGTSLTKERFRTIVMSHWSMSKLFSTINFIAIVIISLLSWPVSIRMIEGFCSLLLVVNYNLLMFVIWMPSIINIINLLNLLLFIIFSLVFIEFWSDIFPSTKSAWSREILFLQYTFLFFGFVYELVFDKCSGKLFD